MSLRPKRAIHRALPFAAVLAAGLMLASCVGVPTTEPSELPAGEWELDPRHASVTWRARHFGLSWMTGRFDHIEASLTFDPENPTAAKLTAIIRAASVSTGLEEFDQTLRGAAWLAVEESPQIVFVSSAIEVTGSNIGRVTGDLTLRGVTREVVMEVEFYGGNFNFLEGQQVIGFGGDIVIDRRDYDVGNLPVTIAGEEIRIRIEADFLRE